MTIQQLRPAATRDADLDLLLTHGPFPLALRAVIADRGLTLEVISRRLRARGMPVSLASLSHWQRGLHLPRPAVWDRLCPALDDLLELAPGTVRMLLEKARTPVDSHAALLSTAESAYVLVRDVIGAGEDTFWPPVSVRQDAVVSSTGWLTSVGVSNLRRANADNVSRVCLIYVALDGRAPEQWLSTTQRVGQVATDEREGSSAVELLLDSPVSRDELVRVDSTVTWSDGPTEFSSAEPQRTVGHCLGDSCRDFSITVQFEAGYSPTRVWLCWSPTPFGQQDLVELRTVEVAGHGVAQATVLEPRPGTYSMHWTS